MDASPAGKLSDTCASDVLVPTTVSVVWPRGSTKRQRVGSRLKRLKSSERAPRGLRAALVGLRLPPGDACPVTSSESLRELSVDSGACARVGMAA